MNSAIKGIYTVGKVTLDLSENYNDLLKSEQNNSLPMLNLPPPICTDTSTLKMLVILLLKVVMKSMVRKF